MYRFSESTKTIWIASDMGTSIRTDVFSQDVNLCGKSLVLLRQQILSKNAIPNWNNIIILHILNLIRRVQIFLYKKKNDYEPRICGLEAICLLCTRSIRQYKIKQGLKFILYTSSHNRELLLVSIYYGHEVNFNCCCSKWNQ